MSLRIAVAVAALFAVAAAHEYSEARDARREAATARARAATEARAAVADLLDAQVGEVAETIDWLHAFYRSDSGLRRPEGLWIAGRPDSTGISTWVVSVYLGSRLRGQGADEARRRVADAIRASDEWKAKHETASAPR